MRPRPFVFAAALVVLAIPVAAQRARAPRGAALPAPLASTLPATSPPADAMRVRVVQLSTRHPSLLVLDAQDMPVTVVGTGAVSYVDLRALSGIAFQEDGHNLLFASLDELVVGRVETLVIVDDAADPTSIRSVFLRGRDFAEPEAPTLIHAAIPGSDVPVTFCLRPAAGPSVVLASGYSGRTTGAATSVPVGAAKLEVHALPSGADPCGGALIASAAFPIAAGYRGLVLHRPAANGGGDVLVCDQDAPYACRLLPLAQP